jgi:transcriptional regulator with XRE-family HTH domain
MKTLGEKLKALRLQKGWSQEDIAYELNMSLPGYSKIERNITDINLSRLSQIAQLYKMSIIEILCYGEKENTDLRNYKKLLQEKDKEIIKLQRKIIDLLERNNRS